jgi:hypothetical protein
MVLANSQCFAMVENVNALELLKMEIDVTQTKILATLALKTAIVKYHLPAALVENVVALQERRKVVLLAQLKAIVLPAVNPKAPV